jgi:hypothetical protein
MAAIATNLIRPALVIAVLLGLAAPVRAQRPAQIIPPSGPFAVGHTAFRWVDSARPELHTENPDDARTLLVDVWYPADPAPGAAPAPLFGPELAGLYSQMLGLEGNPIAAIRANAIPNAPLARADAPFPVIIFDPGFSESPRHYTILIEDLTSRGFVVFGLSHPYVTAIVEFPDGAVIEPVTHTQLARLWAPSDIYEGEFRGMWVPDMLFALDQIAALNRPVIGGMFAGRLDLDRLGLIGHSQGARTAAEVCLLDSRCRGAINLDGAHSAGVELEFDKPYMRILADNGIDAFVANFKYSLEALASEYYVLMIPHTQHMSFVDAAFWQPLVIDRPSQSLIVGQIALLDYRVYVSAFMERIVMGRETPLLDGPSPEHPEVFFLNRTAPIDPPTMGAEPRIAAPGGDNRGELAVGTADVWLYDGRAGEVLDLWLMADRPAGQASQAQRAAFDLMDPMLVVRAPDGSLLAANDDMGASTDSLLRGVALPGDGTYRIEARTWGNQTGGWYTLVLTTDRAEGE